MPGLARSALATAALLVAFAANAETQIRPWAAGKETPVLAGPDLSGRTVDLRQYKGRVVLINFWATWCAPCREEMPSIERLRANLSGQPFDVLTVNFGEGEDRIRDFLRREKLSLPVMLDTDKELAKAWRAGGLPMTFLVDAEGKVRYSAFGECDWSTGEPLRIVQALLTEGAGARR